MEGSKNGSSGSGFDPWASRFTRLGAARAVQERTFYEPLQRDEQGQPYAVTFKMAPLDELDVGTSTDLARQWTKQYITGFPELGIAPGKLKIPDEPRVARLSETFFYDAAVLAVSSADDHPSRMELSYWVGVAENFPTVFPRLLQWVNSLGRKPAATLGGEDDEGGGDNLGNSPQEKPQVTINS